MVIPPGREKRGGWTVSLRHLEPENIPIEAYCAFEIGDLQVDVADANIGMHTLLHLRGGTRAASDPHLGNAATLYLNDLDGEIVYLECLAHVRHAAQM